MECAADRKLYGVTQTTEAAAVQQPPKPTRARVHRAWFVAAVTFVTIIGAAACLYTMAGLPRTAWERFGIWLAVGIAIYAAYGYRRGLSAQRSRGMGQR